MDTKHRSKGHCKFLLRYHLILVCKYRLKLMSASNISSDIKKLSEQIAKKHNVDIWFYKWGDELRLTRRLLDFRILLYYNVFTNQSYSPERI